MMNFKDTLLFIFLLSTLNGQLAVRSAECPVGNRDVSTAGTRHQPTPGLLYLDTSNTAQCNGTITRLRYCYFTGTTSSMEPLEARVSLYRRRTVRFSRESDVFVIRKSVPPPGTSPELVCEYLDLGVAVEVREGDVFGVCIPDTGAESLPIFSELTGSSLGTAPCDTQPPDSAFTFLLTTMDNVVMHIYADTNDVGPTQLTTMVSSVATSEASTQSPVSTPAVVPRAPNATTSSPPVPTTIRDNSATTSHDTNQMMPSIPGERLPFPTREATESDGGSTTARDSTNLAIGVGVGITVAILVLVLVLATAIALGVALRMRRRKREFYFVKQTSSFSTNGLTTSISSAGGIPTSHALGIDLYSTYAEIDNHLSASTIRSIENPEYFMSQREPRKCSRGKNDEGYYCPNAVIYSDLVAKEAKDQELNAYQVPARHETELYAQLTRYGITKINYNDLKSLQHLGSGQFGTVERGVWCKNGQDVEVALKTLNNSQDKSQDKIKLLQEAAIMVQFQHANVLYLYGVARQEDALVVVMELAHKGDLRGYLSSLKKNPALVATELPKLLLSFSQDIARGMVYLSSKGFVHRDLAARNILVTADNICKVADFGMSRDLFDGSYYVMSSGGKVPLKWTAPESLYYNKYSTASDVWSYGCVLYEIWSLGTRPYSKISNEDCIEFVESGKRLSPPPGCPRAIYQLMISCWHPDATSRPSFQDILTALHANDKFVLEVPPKDVTSHSEAERLGAPVECGSGMYKDLCSQYVGHSPVAEESGGGQLCNDYDDVVQ